MANDTPRKLRVPGSTNAVIAATVLLEREVRYNLTTKRIHVGDGVTPGGYIFVSSDAFASLAADQIAEIDGKLLISVAAANAAQAAAGFSLLSDLSTFVAAGKLSPGTASSVNDTDGGTHAAVAGEIRLDGSAATVGELIPNEGAYAVVGGVLKRIGSTNRQKAVAAKDLVLGTVQDVGSSGRPLGTDPITGTASTANLFMLARPLSEDRAYYQVRAFNGSGSSKTITLRRYTLSGTTWTVVAGGDVAVILPNGLNTVPCVFPALKGEYVGVVSPVGGFTITTNPADSGGYYLLANTSPVTKTFPIAHTRMEIGLDYRYVAITGANYSATKASLGGELDALDNIVQSIGLLAGTALPTSGAVGNYTNVFDDVALYSGEITTIRYEGKSVGTAFLGLYNDTGTDLVLAGDETPFPVAVGVNEYVLPFPVKINQGQRVGIYGTTLGAVSNAWRYNGTNHKYLVWGAVTGHVSTLTKNFNKNIRLHVGVDIRRAPSISDINAKIAALESGSSFSRLSNRNPIIPLAVADTPVLTDVNHILFQGDSTSMGTDSLPVYSTVTRYPGLQKTFGSGPRADRPGNTWGGTWTSPGTTTMIDLVEADDGTGAYGETSLSAITAAMIERGIRAGVTGKMWFGSTAGKGGIGIGPIQKGQSQFSKLIGQVTDARTLVLAAGKTYSVPFVVICIGDNEVAPVYATWLAQMTTIVNDMDTDIRGITGQTNPVHTLFVLSPRLSNKVVTRALVELSRTHRLAHIVEPTLFVPRAPDGIHYSTPGSMLVGALSGRSGAQLVYDKRKPDWLEPKAAWDDGTYIYCRFRVPTAPLRFNLNDLNWSTDYGIKVTDDSGTLVLSDIQIIEGDTIRVLPDRPRVGTVLLRVGIDYAVNGVSNDPNPAITSAAITDSTPGKINVPNGSHTAAHQCPGFQLTVSVFAAP